MPMVNNYGMNAHISARRLSTVWAEVVRPEPATGDCCRISELLFGVTPRGDAPLSILTIVSQFELSVQWEAVSIDVEHLPSRLLRLRGQKSGHSM